MSACLRSAAQQVFRRLRTIEDELFYLENILPKRNAEQDLPSAYGITLLNLHKIEIECYDHNQASRALAEKLGFTLEATIRDRKDAQGKRCDDLRYGLLKREWEERR